MPIPPVANAGDDRAVDVSRDVTLTAIELSEPNQSVVWRQVGGPDVTDGARRLRGNDATFLAPGEPSTLFFEVDVTGRGGEVETDDLRIDVFEDADQTVFVDGAAGDDGNDGSRGRPFRSLRRALDFTNGSSTDIYVRTTGETYSTGDALLNSGSSIFGGYDADWIRDTDRRTAITGSGAGVRVFDSVRSVISAVAVVGPDIDGTEPSYGVVAASTGELVIEHASIVAGRSSVVSIGVSTEAVGSLIVTDSTIRGGTGGDGAHGGDAADATAVAENGATAPNDPPRPGAGGGNGGSGGAGGEDLEPGDDGELSTGGAGGESRQGGGAGAGGDGGVGGIGGDGGIDDAGGASQAAGGQPGQSGSRGLGGGGGGGGGGLILHDGGGGGGGGGGGAGGAAGQGGGGGYLSVGLRLTATDEVVLRATTIEGGVAGRGGAGGIGGRGGDGGGGGGGADGISTFVDTAGAGGGGGGGAAGGRGGSGGGGAGGRSVGIITTGSGSIEVSDSTIRGGAGGDGGPGGAGGLTGARGSGGAGQLGGGGGRGLQEDGPSGQPGAPADGGASIGWWDQGNWSRTIDRTTIEAGTPGRSAGPDGRPAAAIDTSF